MKMIDCEKCPLYWEETSDKDDDCGCLQYKDLYGNKFICRLPDFVKRIIAKIIYHRIRRMAAQMFGDVIKNNDNQEVIK